MKPVHYVAIVASAAVIGGGAFLGGVQYQKSKLPVRGNGQFGSNRGGVAGSSNSRAGGQAFRPIVGEILSQDATSLTVKLVDGSSKIIMFSDTTPVNKTAVGTKADLAVGTSVRVIGTTNSDGSVTAQDIQINPAALVLEKTK